MTTMIHTLLITETNNTMDILALVNIIHEVLWRWQRFHEFTQKRIMVFHALEISLRLNRKWFIAFG